MTHLDDEQTQKKDKFSLCYNFSSDEIEKLAKFMRENQEKLPVGLEKFCKSLEDSVYSSLSLEEAGNFYS